MRMLRGRLRDWNSEANLLTEDMELRSSSSTSTLAPGIFAAMASWAARPAETLRTAMTTCTPRIARTRSVSSPMPLDAPALNKGFRIGSAHEFPPMRMANNFKLRPARRRSPL